MAIHGAVANAAGVWITDLPITPEKILKAIRRTTAVEESAALSYTCSSMQHSASVHEHIGHSGGQTDRKETTMTSGARPDYSDYVAHFTKDKMPWATDYTEDETIKHIAEKTAKERLIAILEEKKIVATSMPWKTGHAVAFTECPWGSLLSHAKRYSPYGVGFTKAHLYAAHGGPAFYVRADLYKKQEWASDVHKFVTPFNPDYAPEAMKKAAWLEKKAIDFSHEREWRVPHHFTFRLDQVQFVIVDKYEDVAGFPQSLKDEIGREKFLIMDVYRRIETIWPVHRL